MSIIILSRPSDAHLPFVTQHLARPPVIIDFQDLVDNGDISITTRKRATVIFKGVPLKNVTGVWVRRPFKIIEELQIPVNPQYLDYSQSSLSKFTNIFYTLWPEATWISDYYAIRRAGSKPLQQTVAAEIGFAIPATLYTADNRAARAFVRKHAPAVIVKPLANRAPNLTKDMTTGFYTRKLTSVNEIRLEGLRLAPAIFQQLIEPKQEFRVTVVGDQVFSALVHSPDHAIVRDWRMGQNFDQVKLQASQLPREMEEKCLRLVEKLGLRFGAIDLIQDKQGTFWFLEINPNGQWAFVEELTGLPIGKAIAELLEGHQTKKKSVAL